MTILQLLTQRFVQYFTELEICQVLKLFTDVKSFWPEGLKSLLKSNYVKVLFENFRPEYKEMFIAASLVEPLLEILNDENADEKFGEETLDDVAKYLKSMIKELK